MGQTSEQYQQIVQNCREIFKQKTKDYGTSWRIARASSLTDQIFIKANRIRTIQETNENKTTGGNPHYPLIQNLSDFPFDTLTYLVFIGFLDHGDYPSA